MSDSSDEIIDPDEDQQILDHLAEAIFDWTLPPGLYCKWCGEPVRNGPDGFTATDDSYHPGYHCRGSGAEHAIAAPFDAGQAEGVGET